MEVKICCIANLDEARIAISAGATALGLVGPMPSGPGVIADEQIAEIAAGVPSGIRTFLLTSETQVEGIAEHHARTKTTTIQLVDALHEKAYDELRRALPGVEIVQVIHVRNENALPEALEVASRVDALLLDSGNPDLNVKELGGTGRVHDWNISRQIVRHSPIPVFLAGGLHAGNVGQARAAVSPDGFDLCSGVRSNGRLDPRKLEAFFLALQSSLPV